MKFNISLTIDADTPDEAMTNAQRLFSTPEADADKIWRYIKTRSYNLQLEVVEDDEAPERDWQDNLDLEDAPEVLNA
jgi:hypothetical protein